ncbi:hypothetical protein [Dictyobacter aurantiacus]|uniref:Aminoglycoside phosphotransferase domain-containing protein n=1 Tax=Dictyobacter aurantiacus TaxID=1936993 RepID=A0A401ZB82_9CHLR|nr:hypothetical protein [Dictyobacter aurantiacus]GCE04102.1 hypothetical protein KDAU_14310 [Dictyobacter aurantiacus]
MSQDETTQPLHAVETIAQAEQLLNRHYDTTIRLGPGDDLGGSQRSRVYRCSVLEGPELLASGVIIKQVSEPDGSPRQANQLFLNEWASLQFVQALSPEQPLAPRFYVGDLNLSMFIMEDLGPGEQLNHVLLGHDGTRAEAALLDYAGIHGRLHALSMGKQAEYTAIRAALGPQEESRYFRFDWLHAQMEKIITALNVRPEPGIERELQTLQTALTNPGPFLAFMQGDACPDNVIQTSRGVRMIDFEGGMYVHALIEGAYGRVPFPTCRCLYRIPEHIAQEMEVRYRSELSQGCPEATDDTLFYQGLIEATSSWALGFHTMVPLEIILPQDRFIMALTDRQRYLLFFENAARLCAKHGYMQAIGGTLEKLAQKMRLLWPDTEEPPCYPAFQSPPPTLP